MAAGTVEDPAKLWTVAIPRAEVTLQPGGESYIEVGENIRVVMGSAEVRLTKDGYTFTDEAQPVLKQEKAEAKVSRTIGGVKVSNSTPDVLEAAGTASWQIPSRVASAYSVTDGAHLTFVAGDEADGTNVIRTVSLADGHVISEHSVVAGAAQPREIQSAAHGIFAYDKQFSTIAYYPAG